MMPLIFPGVALSLPHPALNSSQAAPGSRRPCSGNHRAFQDRAALEQLEHFAQLAQPPARADDTSSVQGLVAQYLEGTPDIARAKMKRRQQAQIVVMHPP